MECHRRGEYVAIIPFFVNDHGIRELKLEIQGTYTGKRQFDRDGNEIKSEIKPEDKSEIKSEQKQDQTKSKPAENQTENQVVKPELKEK